MLKTVQLRLNLISQNWRHRA